MRIPVAYVLDKRRATDRKALTYARWRLNPTLFIADCLQGFGKILSCKSLSIPRNETCKAQRTNR
jgi:hypothetical protein